MGKSKSAVSVISSILVLLIMVSSFTYAYFTADTTNTTGLNITTTVSDSFIPVFTAYTMGDLNVEVTDADMLKPDASTDHKTIGDSASENIYVKLLAGGPDSPGTCTFDLYWTDTSSTTYVPSSAASSAGLNEYTIKIVDETGATVFAETKIDTLISQLNASRQVTLASNLSITASGTEVSKTYTVTATVYNLNVAQTIYGKSYTSRVDVANVNC